MKNWEVAVFLEYDTPGAVTGALCAAKFHGILLTFLFIPADGSLPFFLSKRIQALFLFIQRQKKIFSHLVHRLGQFLQENERVFLERVVVEIHQPEDLLVQLCFVGFFREVLDDLSDLNPLPLNMIRVD